MRHARRNHRNPKLELYVYYVKIVSCVSDIEVNRSPTDFSSLETDSCVFCVACVINCSIPNIIIILSSLGQSKYFGPFFFFERKFITNYSEGSNCTRNRQKSRRLSDCLSAFKIWQWFLNTHLLKSIACEHLTNLTKIVMHLWWYSIETFKIMVQIIDCSENNSNFNIVPMKHFWNLKCSESINETFVYAICR